jgi:hypothetical protein
MAFKLYLSIYRSALPAIHATNLRDAHNNANEIDLGRISCLQITRCLRVPIQRLSGRSSIWGSVLGAFLQFRDAATVILGQNS